MRSYASKFFAIVAVLLFAAVVWASTRTDTARYDVTQTMEIGQAQLKPGRYTLKANESQHQIQVMRNGKLVASVRCHWIRLNQKPASTEIFSSKNRVTRVEFAGRQEAARVG